MILVLALFSASAPAQKNGPPRFTVADLDKLVSISDTQISPDGRLVVFAVSRVNMEKNRFERELVLLDLSSKEQRVLTYDREGVGQPRWSPQGERLAFVAKAPALADGKGGGKYQLYVMPMSGGDAKRITDSPTGVQHFSWSPDGKQFAFAAADESPKRGKFDDAFEIHNDGYLITKEPTPTHIWLVAAGGGTAKRLTSGAWSLPRSQPPGSPSSALSWSPDG